MTLINSLKRICFCKMAVKDLCLAGIADSSTLDYIGKVSAVIYLCGCPYRCPWCQNPDLVEKAESVCKTLSIDSIINALREDYLIGAVSITGGEPLMQPAVIDLLKEIKKETALCLKIDTNGFYPERLAEALPYLDFFSMDIKAPLDERYGKAIGLQDMWGEAVKNVKKCLALLKEWNNPKEARTTIISGLTDKKEDVVEIALSIKDAGFDYYTLQQFRPGATLDPKYSKAKIPAPAFMRELGRAAKEALPDTVVKIVTQQKGFEEISFSDA
jgi:pyruvate formate lyase activating enzyme